MKQGKTLAELGRELQRQRLNRQDFLADTRSLEMETDSYGSTLQLSLDDKPLSFTVGETAHQQIAARLNIPFRYYKKMQEEAPDLLDRNVNTWFGKNPERRMIRNCIQKKRWRRTTRPFSSRCKILSALLSTKLDSC